ncbi:MAG: hypothetical protein V3571_05720 [Pseudodesulfovibrio sp.]
MFILLLIILLAAFGLIFLFRSISMNRTYRVNALEEQRQKVKSKYEYLRGQKQDLAKTLEEREHQLTTLRNNQDGIKTLSSKELNLAESKNSPDDKVSRYLVKTGAITMEQNEKVLVKMKTLNMDFLGTCLTLGYVNLETAKKALKANKIEHTLET